MGLADGVVPTSVSWRLVGLGDEATVLPVTMRVLEAEVCPPELKVRTPAHTKQLGWCV